MNFGVDSIKFKWLGAIHMNGVLKEGHSPYYVGGQPGTLNIRARGTYTEVGLSFSWIQRFSQGARPELGHDEAASNPGYARGANP